MLCIVSKMSPTMIKPREIHSFIQGNRTFYFNCIISASPVDLYCGWDISHINEEQLNK